MTKACMFINVNHRHRDEKSMCQGVHLRLMRWAGYVANVNEGLLVKHSLWLICHMSKTSFRVPTGSPNKLIFCSHLRVTRQKSFVPVLLLQRDASSISNFRG